MTMAIAIQATVMAIAIHAIQLVKRLAHQATVVDQNAHLETAQAQRVSQIIQMVIATHKTLMVTALHSIKKAAARHQIQVAVIVLPATFLIALILTAALVFKTGQVVEQTTHQAIVRMTIIRETADQATK